MDHTITSNFSVIFISEYFIGNESKFFCSSRSKATMPTLRVSIENLCLIVFLNEFYSQLNELDRDR